MAKLGMLVVGVMALAACGTSDDTGGVSAELGAAQERVPCDAGWEFPSDTTCEAACELPANSDLRCNATRLGDGVGFVIEDGPNAIEFMGVRGLCVASGVVGQAYEGMEFWACEP